MKRMEVIIALCFFAIAAGCATPAAVEPSIIVETVLVEVTAPPVATYTPYPTYTPLAPLPTYTVSPTQTPYPTHTRPPEPTKTPRPTSTPTPATPRIGTRSNPVPMGDSMPLVMDGKKHFTLFITEVRRGAGAWSAVKEANMFNDPPADGQEYVMAWVEVEYGQGPEDEPLEIRGHDFKSVSLGHILDAPTVVSPKPALDISWYPGASGGGWIVLTVNVDDAAPLAAIGMNYDNTGGFFFALTR